MYALLNRMDSTDVFVGRVLSRHRTIEAAERANATLQRATRRANGRTCYIPCAIVELLADLRVRAWARRDDVRYLDEIERTGA